MEACIEVMCQRTDIREVPLLKNIIIVGPSRAGKTTLAKRINEELNYFVISLDKLVAVFGRAYPELDLSLIHI